MLTRRMFRNLMDSSSADTQPTGPDLLARAAPALCPNGFRGVEHVVVLMLGHDDVDRPVTDALAAHYTVLQRYFCSYVGESFPNRLCQHTARTELGHNVNQITTLPSIWDQLSPVPNNRGVPTGGYFFRDLPFLALWGRKFVPFWHPFAGGDADLLGIPVTAPSFLDVVAAGDLPNVSFVDPPFAPPVSSVESLVADTYHALSDAGYLDSTVLIVTSDQSAGFDDHPPAIVVSNLAEARVVRDGPFEHPSTLALIESTFGLQPMTAWDRDARNITEVLLRTPRRPVPAGTVPTGVHNVRSMGLPWHGHAYASGAPASWLVSAGSVQFGCQYWKGHAGSD